MPSLSIVIPVFNVEKYLRQCVNSVLNQTMQDIEIILIDDGSTDKSGEICDEYARKDKRVRVIHKSNEGLSCARNDGIDASTAQYIMFVDSDDWVDSDYCELPFKTAIKHNADLVFFRYSSSSQLSGQEPVEPTYFSRIHAIRFIYQNHAGMAWNKLYHRSMFQNTRFMAGKYYEDGPFGIEILENASNIYYIDKSLYHHRDRSGSITNTGSKDISNDYYLMSSLTATEIERMGLKTEADTFRLEYNWTYLVRYGRKAPYAKECINYLRGYGKVPEGFKGKRKLMFIMLKTSLYVFDMLSVVFMRRMRIKY